MKGDRGKKMIKIAMFYTSDCKGSVPALNNLKAVLERVDAKCELTIHAILTEKDAIRWKVFGSPTIYVNGKDIEKEASDFKGYGIQYRTYREGQKTMSAPSRTMILKAINQELPDPMICYCKGVRKSAITDALKNGAKTFKEIQETTGASTGNECKIKNPTGKCCSPFVVEIIKKGKAEQPIIIGEETCCERR